MNDQMVPQEAWVPKFSETVRIISSRGIFQPYAGMEGNVVSVNTRSQEVVVVVNHQSLIAQYPGDIAPVDAVAEPKGSVVELLTRITRLGAQLKDEMRVQAVVGFGDGARWRADVVDGLLVVREVKAE